jgi:hypothetical protein
MPSCVIEAISADRLPWLMSSAPPIDVAGSDTVSSSQANSAMTRTQREAKKVCVEREDDMLGKLISRRPPRSTRFCPAPDGCKATGHISPYFFDSFQIRPGCGRKLRPPCEALGHQIDDARLGPSSVAMAATAMHFTRLRRTAAAALASSTQTAPSDRKPRRFLQQRSLFPT